MILGASEIEGSVVGEVLKASGSVTVVGISVVGVSVVGLSVVGVSVVRVSVMGVASTMVVNVSAHIHKSLGI